MKASLIPGERREFLIAEIEARLKADVTLAMDAWRARIPGLIRDKAQDICTTLTIMAEGLDTMVVGDED